MPRRRPWEALERIVSRRKDLRVLEKGHCRRKRVYGPSSSSLPSRWSAFNPDSSTIKARPLHNGRALAFLLDFGPWGNPQRFHDRNTLICRSPQLCILSLGLLQDGDVGTGVLPEGQEILVSSSSDDSKLRNSMEFTNEYHIARSDGSCDSKTFAIWRPSISNDRIRKVGNLTRPTA